MRASTTRQQVTFGFKDAKDWDEEAVRQAIESQTSFKVGKVLERNDGGKNKSPLEG